MHVLWASSFENTHFSTTMAFYGTMCSPLNLLCTPKMYIFNPPPPIVYFTKHRAPLSTFWTRRKLAKTVTAMGNAKAGDAFSTLCVIFNLIPFATFMSDAQVKFTFYSMVQPSWSHHLPLPWPIQKSVRPSALLMHLRYWHP